MSNETLLRWSIWLLYTMQVSIAVPMLVVWRRRRQFPTPIRLLSWYVYLSAAASAGATFLYPAYFATNYGFIVGFNLGKVALLGAVYYQVLESARQRQVVAATTLLTLLIGLGIGVSGQLLQALTFSRLAQCTVLAGFALLYLDQDLKRPPRHDTARDPLWLLSVAQLLYSASTVAVFSLEAMLGSDYVTVLRFNFVSGAGLVFNGLLTLAFLRATPDGSAAPTGPPAAVPDMQAVGYLT